MIQSSGVQHELNYAAIWARQALSPVLERQLTIIASSVFEVIVHPPEGFQNVTEWCKKEPCWRRVHDLPIDQQNDFVAELADKSSDRSSREGARRQQDVDNRIGAQIRVVELGRQYWVELAAWSRARRLATDEQDNLLSLAVRMPVIIPTERQSAKLLELKARMEEEGFRYR